MTADHRLRQNLLEMLRGGTAHLTFDDAVADFPAALRGAKAAGVPHTAWRLLEHLRIAQWDILEFSRNPRHISPAFPEGYWPTEDAPPDPEAWDRSVSAFRADLTAMQELVADADTELLAPLPHARDKTILREALVLAQHNSYHLGQLLFLRRALGAWRDD